jgi:redox-sensitive bicupin YhaK (pirin superfamily)
LPPAKTQLIRPGSLPEYSTDNGTSIRVVIGSVGKYTSPVLADWPLLYLHIKMSALAKVSLPLFSANCRGFIYN